MRLVLNMMQLLLIASSALWHAAAAASRSSSQVVDYLPVKLKTGSSSGSTPSPSLDLLLPTRGELSITSPRDLFMTVAEPWQKLVEENQAGLVDAKQEGAVRGAGLGARVRVCIGCIGCVGEWESGRVEASVVYIVRTLHVRTVVMYGVVGVIARVMSHSCLHHHHSCLYRRWRHPCRRGRRGITMRRQRRASSTAVASSSHSR